MSGRRRSTPFLLLAVVPILALALPPGALASTLDTQGELTWCDVVYGAVTKATFKGATVAESWYEFEGTYSYSPHDSAAACPGGTSKTTATGTWVKSQNRAVEEIKTPYQGGKVLRTVSSCPKNPWLNPGVACTLLEKSLDILGLPAGPFPATAAKMTDSQKAQLLSAEQSFIPMPLAPVVNSPKPGAAYLLPAKVPISVGHQVGGSVGFEFGWRSHAPKPNEFPEGYQTVPGVVVDNLKTSGGVTTGELGVGKAGQWRLRAQVAFPGAPWSEWVEFTVSALALAPRIEGIKLPPITGTLGTPPVLPAAPAIEKPAAGKVFTAPEKVPLRVTHQKGLGLAFTFERWATAASAWKEDLETKPEGLAEVDGVTTAKVVPSKAGKWRVRARCNVSGAPWSPWREFTYSK